MDADKFINDLLIWLPEKFRREQNFREFVEALLHLVYEVKEDISNLAKLYSPTDLQDKEDIENLEMMLHVLPSSSKASNEERMRGLLYATDFIKIKGLLQSIQYYLYKKRLSLQNIEMDVRYLWTGPAGSETDYKAFVPQDIGENLRKHGLSYYPTPHFYIAITSGELSETDKQELELFIDRVRPIDTVLEGIFVERLALIPAVIVLPHGERAVVPETVITMRPAPPEPAPKKMMITENISLRCSDL